MPERKEAGREENRAQLTKSLERVWQEVKQISRQVERETRRSGRVARLRLDLRQLERQLFEVRARLGKAVYDAQLAAEGELQLGQVEGYSARVAALDDLHAQIRAKQEEIEGLRSPSPETGAGQQPATTSKKIAGEAAGA
ncbi:MAG: hypothetical protein ACE5HV_15830 [Acidobacteriota bacterium]